MRHYLSRTTAWYQKLQSIPGNTVSSLTRDTRRPSTSFIDIELVVAFKGNSNRGLRRHIVRQDRARLIIISCREHTAYPGNVGRTQIRVQNTCTLLSPTAKACASHVHPRPSCRFT